MKDYYNQGGGRIFKEIDEKELSILKIKDTRQVGVSKRILQGFKSGKDGFIDWC